MEKKSQHPSADLGDIPGKANAAVLVTSTLRFLVQTRERKHEKNGLVLTFFLLSSILLYLKLPF